MTEAIVFGPSQIKSVENETPTENPDYRYSFEENRLRNRQHPRPGADPAQVRG
jgi:hypothetical protein